MYCIDGIVAYSIFQMPYEDSERNKIFKKIIKQKKKLYFANEGFKVSNFDDAKRINMIWLIKKTLNKCPNIKDLKYEK